jgi:hypothetical protein
LLLQLTDRLNGLNQWWPSQKAEALTALEWICVVTVVEGTVIFSNGVPRRVFCLLPWQPESLYHLPFVIILLLQLFPSKVYSFDSRNWCVVIFHSRNWCVVTFKVICVERFYWAKLYMNFHSLWTCDIGCASFGLR